MPSGNRVAASVADPCGLGTFPVPSQVRPKSDSPSDVVWAAQWSGIGCADDYGQSSPNSTEQDSYPPGYIWLVPCPVGNRPPLMS